MKSTLALITMSTLTLLSGPTAIVALEPQLEVSQYAHKAWTIQDGFLRGGVRAIAQTPDGYLWLGTEFGLVRFDGIRFVEWNPPNGQQLPSTNIRTLIAAHDGTLWIGTLEGLTSWKDGKLKSYPEIPRQNVLALLEDSEGTVWAGTFGVPKGQLCAIRAGRVQCYGDDGSLGQWVWSIYEDDGKRLWVGAETGLWQWKPGSPKRYAMPHPIETSQSIAQTAPQAGPLVVAEGLWQLVEGKLKDFPLATRPGHLTTPVNVFRDSSGGLWVGTLQDGILHVNAAGTSAFAQTEGLSGDRILAFFEDREGNLWAGTREGLDRFRVPAVFSISTKQGISSASIWSVLVARDNSVWLSTLDGLNRWKDGHVTVYRSAAHESERLKAITKYVAARGQSGPNPAVTDMTDPGLPDNRVGSLYEDNRGRIWVSTPGGIARFEDGKFTHVKEVPPGWVNAIAGDNNGGVWISYQDHGLMHWVDGRVVERVPWSQVGGEVIASSVMPDANRGGLWLGFFEGGLVYFKDGRVQQQYRTSDGLGHGRVMGLQLDDDGTIWVATEGGLSRLKDGRIVTLTTANGLPCNTVHWSMQDEGSFWLHTSCGLLQIPSAEMQEWSADPKGAIQFNKFDISDGVRTYALPTGYTPHVSKAADGKLWFAHFASVSVIDPVDLRVNEIPPPVHIEQITANGKSYAATPGLRLPSRIRDVAIEYTALSLVAPEKVHFKYKLEGQDRNWREVINDRHVQYSNLAPGNYRFQVIANNNSGLWNEQGDSLEFSIAPAYYQTAWFRILCVVSFFALLWAAYEWRLRHLRHHFEISVQARVQERTRIARELHDTLLQSFHGLLLRFQTVSQLLPEYSPAKEKLDSAIEQAADAITEGRDAVQGLRDSTSQRNDLAQAIRTLGEELAREHITHRPEFLVTVAGESRDLHPILRDEVYKIAVEAMRNAFLHAEARRVEVEIRYDNEQFRMHVRDDGKGINAALLEGEGSEGHFGLRGMRERATLLGAKLTVWSEVGAGTEVEVQVPAHIVYESARRASWLSRKFAGKTDAEVGEPS